MDDCFEEIPKKVNNFRFSLALALALLVWQLTWADCYLEGEKDCRTRISILIFDFFRFAHLLKAHFSLLFFSSSSERQK